MECAEGEQPRADDVTFLLEAAPPSVAAATTEASASASAPAEVSTDDSLVVFAVDVSGSMDSGAGGPVSRLQAAKAAVIKQLDQLENEHPHRRVALITFSDDVNVYGDCMWLCILMYVFVCGFNYNNFDNTNFQSYYN